MLRCPRCKLSGDRDELATRNQLIVVVSLLRGEARPAQYRFGSADPRPQGGKKRTRKEAREAEAVALAAYKKSLAAAAAAPAFMSRLRPDFVRSAVFVRDADRSLRSPS